MKKNMISLCALLLFGAASMMTAGAQTKPTLAVFVVGGDNTLVTPLTTALGNNLTSGGRYALTSVSTSDKLTELQNAYTAGGGSSINRNALAAWGHDNSISAICLVVDDKKGNDHLFSAQLIDTKDSKLDGRGSYTRTSVSTGDASRVALALAKQLEGPGRMARRDVTPQQKWFEPEMVFVEGATSATLGWRSTDADRSDGAKTSENGTNNNILDPYTATVPSFRIGKYEVTQAQWRAVMAGTKFENYFYWGGSRGVANGALNSATCGNVPCDDQRPVEYVTWYMAVAFCNELSKQAGLTEAYTVSSGADKYLIDNLDDLGNCTTCGDIALVANATGYRLPTINEWEYAARGCKAGSCESFKYSGSNDIGEVAWNATSTNAGYSRSTTHPVGQLKPNRLGIYDMSGNVWEWCWDIFTGTTSRIRRSGGWDNPVPNGWHRIAMRLGTIPSNRMDHVGFRVALPAQ
jgi:formylglycine-generating enzyme required for sulfatase activity